MILTYDAYSETLAEQESKEKEVAELRDELKAVNDRMAAQEQMKQNEIAQIKGELKKYQQDMFGDVSKDFASQVAEFQNQIKELEQQLKGVDRLKQSGNKTGA
jgi:gas vesicle protein